jgi:hypothetical protein
MRIVRLLGILLLGVLAACGEDAAERNKNAAKAMQESGETGHFALVSPDASGVTFANILSEDEKQNYLNFQYIYNGGGVAVGDINNDGLPDIYFTGNEVANKLYLNKGNLVFEDVTEAAGVAGDNGWHTGVSMVDINNDGWLDIYICKSAWRKEEENRHNLLYINQGDGSFREEAKAYGLVENGFSIQSSFFDYDQDGDLDVYITNHPMEFGRPIPNRDEKVKNPPEPMRDKLYRNDGGNKFSEVGRQVGIINYSHGLGIVTSDVNQDGWVDIYVTNDYDEPDFLYINQGNGTFREDLQKMTNHISLYAMGIDIADVNNDGLADIMTTEMLPESYKRSKTNMASMDPDWFVTMTKSGMGYQYMHNSLQINRGNQHFSEISQMAGVAKTDWSWACLISDYDNDGLKDIFIVNGYKRDVFDKDFAKESAKIIAKNNGNLPLFDLYEIMPSTKLTNYIYKNNGDLTFAKKSLEWGLAEETMTQGAAIGDLDGDGDLDLVLNNLDDPAMIYENQSTNNGNNYLRIQLTGPAKNKRGLNAKVVLKNGEEQQYQEMLTVRGYQSSVEPILHFGLGNQAKVEKIEVRWPDGKVSEMTNVPANQLLTIDYAGAKPAAAGAPQKASILADRTSELLDQPFVHRENEFDDYQVQVLLPHKLSQLGPFTAVGDVNGDGREDFYIGGAKDQAGALYTQTAAGSFKRQSQPVFDQDKSYEDMDAVFFDADQDGDLDLYVVSGGTELPAKHAFYQDRLYLNSGSGSFTKSNALPEVLASGSCVSVYDFDKDGDLDIFVGGRVIPNIYPHSTQSYLFRNDGGTFTEIGVASGRAMALQGMVNSAIWTDFDNDGWVDLITAGEWMPIKFLKNQNGASFADVTAQYGMSNTVGWWNKIVESDIDGDGDMDYVLGNLGLNYKFHASQEKPFHVYAADFDGNQSMDIVLAKYDGDIEVPVRGRQCSSEQMPFVAEKFPSYAAFADASVGDMLGTGINEALHIQAQMFESVVLINNGGAFEINRLPVEAQFSTINGIIPQDFNGDGHVDLLIAGNMFGSEPETTRADASIGLLLAGDGKGNFKAVPAIESGFVVPFDVKDLQTIKIAGTKTAILVACNNDALRLYTTR